MAVAPHPQSVIAAPEVVLRRPRHVVHNHQVQPSVVVVVEPGGARTPPPYIFHSRTRRHIREPAVADALCTTTTATARSRRVRRVREWKMYGAAVRAPPASTTLPGCGW